jgi:hypothetical protein
MVHGLRGRGSLRRARTSAGENVQPGFGLFTRPRGRLSPLGLHHRLQCDLAIAVMSLKSASAIEAYKYTYTLFHVLIY